LASPVWNHVASTRSRGGITVRKVTGEPAGLDPRNGTRRPRCARSARWAWDPPKKGW
jgi:hypothetical protein